MCKQQLRLKKRWTKLRGYEFKISSSRSVIYYLDSLSFRTNLLASILPARRDFFLTDSQQWGKNQMLYM